MLLERTLRTESNPFTISPVTFKTNYEAEKEKRKMGNYFKGFVHESVSRGLIAQIIFHMIVQILHIHFHQHVISYNIYYICFSAYVIPCSVSLKSLNIWKEILLMVQKEAKI